MNEEPVQASGGDGREGEDDGVQNAPGKRAGGGESGGGAYPDPAVEDDKGTGGFMGHGGQHDIAYSGTGDADEAGEVGNDNAVTR